MLKRVRSRPIEFRAIQIQNSAKLQLGVRVAARNVFGKDGGHISVHRTFIHIYRYGDTFEIEFDTAFEVIPREGDWLIEVAPNKFNFKSANAFAREFEEVVVIHEPRSAQLREF